MKACWAWTSKNLIRSSGSHVSRREDGVASTTHGNGDIGIFKGLPDEVAALAGDVRVLWIYNR